MGKLEIKDQYGDRLLVENWHGSLSLTVEEVDKLVESIWMTEDKAAVRELAMFLLEYVGEAVPEPVVEPLGVGDTVLFYKCPGGDPIPAVTTSEEYGVGGPRPCVGLCVFEFSAAPAVRYFNGILIAESVEEARERGLAYFCVRKG